MSEEIDSIRAGLKTRLRNIGRRIRKAREEIYTSLDAFSQATGLSKSYINLVENGEKVPSFWALKRISRVLKRSPAWLLTGHEGSLKNLCLDEQTMQFLVKNIKKVIKILEKRPIKEMSRVFEREGVKMRITCLEV